jgi:hypothetical protein
MLRNRLIGCLLIAAGVACYALLPTPPKPSTDFAPQELGFKAREVRAVFGFLRPLTLPWFWLRIDQAVREGRTEEAVAAARWVAYLLPESYVVWSLFGLRLAYDVSSQGVSVDDEFDRIEAAVAWLETGARVLGDDPDLCLTIAFMLQDRLAPGTERRADLARRFQHRYGQPPETYARGWLEEASRRGLRSTSQDFRLMHAAVQLARRNYLEGDLATAARFLERGLSDLAATTDEDAGVWRQALQEGVQLLERLQRPDLADTERAALRAALATSQLEFTDGPRR